MMIDLCRLELENKFPENQTKYLLYLRKYNSLIPILLAHYKNKFVRREKISTGKITTNVLNKLHSFYKINLQPKKYFLNEKNIRNYFKFDKTTSSREIFCLMNECLS